VLAIWLVVIAHVEARPHLQSRLDTVITTSTGTFPSYPRQVDLISRRWESLARGRQIVVQTSRCRAVAPACPGSDDALRQHPGSTRSDFGDSARNSPQKGTLKRGCMSRMSSAGPAWWETAQYLGICGAMQFHAKTPHLQVKQVFSHLGILLGSLRPPRVG
jgi:hypothetical protein